MRSLLVNSQGNAAYALVYANGQSVLLRTNPMIYSGNADLALSFVDHPWGVVFGTNQD